MTNYKPFHENITVAGYTVPVPPSGVSIHLVEKNNAGTANDSFEEIDGTVYQVPSGKKFVLLGVSINVIGTGGGNFVIYEGATANATTTTKLSTTIPTETLRYQIFVNGNYTFASSTFIVHNGNVDTGFLDLYGYEIDT